MLDTIAFVLTDPDNLLKIVEIGVSALVPIVILIIGILIIRKLNTHKNKLKEKEWQIKWADSFYRAAARFNETVTDCVMELNKLDGINDRNEQLSNALQMLEWELEAYTQFCKKNADYVNDYSGFIFRIFQKFTAEKRVDFEILKEAQFGFNRAVRRAHDEILKSRIKQFKENDFPSIVVLKAKYF